MASGKLFCLMLVYPFVKFKFMCLFFRSLLCKNSLILNNSWFIFQILNLYAGLKCQK